MIFQLTGLPAAGKTSISNLAAQPLRDKNISCKIIDGDIFRKEFSSDLGFTEADRHENIRRMGAYAFSLTQEFQVIIIAAINPYDVIRRELLSRYNAQIIFIKCGINELIRRDPKGLYSRALLPDDHQNKIDNFTGISDPYQAPENAVLVIDTEHESLPVSAGRLVDFILQELNSLS